MCWFLLNAENCKKQNLQNNFLHLNQHLGYLLNSSVAKQSLCLICVELANSYVILISLSCSCKSGFKLGNVSKCMSASFCCRTKNFSFLPVQFSWPVSFFSFWKKKSSKNKLPPLFYLSLSQRSQWCGRSIRKTKHYEKCSAQRLSRTQWRPLHHQQVLIWDCTGSTSVCVCVNMCVCVCVFFFWSSAHCRWGHCVAMPKRLMGRSVCVRTQRKVFNHHSICKDNTLSLQD